MHVLRHKQEQMIAVAAVRSAARLAEEVGAALTAAHQHAKSDASPVTVADYGVQALVLHALRRVFAADPTVAEEDGGALSRPEHEPLLATVGRFVRAQEPGLTEADILRCLDDGSHRGGPAGRFWTLDPVDGTKGFLRGGHYAIALALIESGAPVLGVLGCPRLPIMGAAAVPAARTVFLAARGQGAWRVPEAGEPVPLRVSRRERPGEAVFCESVESGHSAHDVSARIASLLGNVTPPQRLDSQAKYALVARGDADIYLRLPTREDYRERIWDHAAGALLLQEAGGCVTDIDGKPLDFSRGRTLLANRGVVATNGLLHSAVLRAVAEALAG